MTPILTVFASSPDRGRGLARDMPVRWALEEAGVAYAVRTVSFAEMREGAHLARQPFGQIPCYEEGDLVLFESGAIVHHIALAHGGLLPDGADARALALAWMFAAVSTIEPPVVERSMAVLFESDRAWHGERLEMLDERVRKRLRDLAVRLGGAEWLDGGFGGGFSAGDLMVVSVLRRLAGSGLLEEFPALAAYVARGEARAPFQRAFAAQRALFEAGGG